VTEQSDRLIRRATIAASAGLVLMVLATMGYIMWPRFAVSMGVRAASTPPYVAGQKIDVPSAWYTESPHTLIVFARASCAACEKAQPFLKQLVQHMNGRGVPMMAHPPGAPEEDAIFARTLGVAPEHIKMTTENLRVRATPTIVLVDWQGRVVNAWEGATKPEDRLAMIAAVDALVR